MEDKRRVFTHFTGIIRLIAFIALVSIVAFFAVRWIQSRADSRRAQEAIRTAQNEKEKNKQSESDSDRSSQTSGDGVSTQDSSSSQTVPSGIADSDVVDINRGQELPDAGMDSSAILVAIILSLGTYFSVRYVALRD